MFTAVTTNNDVFWDIKPQFLPHRKHITSPLQNPAGKCPVRFEVFTAVTMKYVVFWDIKKTVLTSQETYYVSATEPSLLTLCKILEFSL
jgi:hypothetical protein